MRVASKTFLHDCRGATVPEYALILFAVLLVGAAATRQIGGGVQRNADVTRRILDGENIQMSGGGNGAPSGATASGNGSSEGASANSSGGGEASGAGGTASGSGGGSVASAGGSSAGGGGSSGATGPSAAGGGVVLGASGASGATGSAASGGGEAAGGGSSGSTVGSILSAGADGTGAGGGVVGDLGGAVADSAHGGGSSSSSGGGSSSGSSVAASVASTASKTIVGSIFNAIFGGDDNTSSGSTTPSHSGAVENQLPSAKTTASESSNTGVLGASNAPTNNVNPPPPESGTDTSGGTSYTIEGNTFTVSAEGERQMAALAGKAKANAGAKRPKGYCYHQVKIDIQQTGYGDISKQAANAQLRPLPGSDQGYAHDFADYMNERGSNGHTNADNLGLQKLPITNPYDAPKGAIIVVRAGTPGTHHPTAGDIVVAGGNGKFYNDGNMGYGGSKNFKPGNSYVLGIYVPK